MTKSEAIEYFRRQVSVELSEITGEPTEASTYQGVRRWAQLTGVTHQAVYKLPEQLAFPHQCMLEVVTNGRLRADREAPRTDRARRSPPLTGVFSDTPVA